MVKTVVFRTIKDYSKIKDRIERIVEEHNIGPYNESGKIVIFKEPKLHLFTLAVKEIECENFEQVLAQFNEINDVKVKSLKIKESELHYGDITVYLSFTKKQNDIIKDVASISNVKRNVGCLVIGTVKENFNVSLDMREQGLKIIMRKICAFFKTVTFRFNDAQYITL
jgi:hypothetical protein